MCTILLADINDFKEFNDIYAAWLEGTILPARAAYAVKDLPAGALVEVMVQAVKGSAGGAKL
jgi:2-iminobutanoate/2-iminopropanoate deaminase